MGVQWCSTKQEQPIKRLNCLKNGVLGSFCTKPSQLIYVDPSDDDANTTYCDSLFRCSSEGVITLEEVDNIPGIVLTPHTARIVEKECTPPVRSLNFSRTPLTPVTTRIVDKRLPSSKISRGTQPSTSCRNTTVPNMAPAYIPKALFDNRMT